MSNQLAELNMADPMVYRHTGNPHEKPNRLIGKQRELYAKYLHLLREGASLDAAAGCIGLDKKMVYSWLKRAEKANYGTHLAKFARETVQAMNDARSSAEMTIRKRDPKAWLRANAPEMWHEEAQTVIVNDNRKIAFTETLQTGDLAQCMATLESLGLAPSLPDSGTAKDAPKTIEGQVVGSDDDSRSDSDE